MHYQSPPFKGSFMQPHLALHTNSHRLVPARATAHQPVSMANPTNRMQVLRTLGLDCQKGLFPSKSFFHWTKHALNYLPLQDLIYIRRHCWVINKHDISSNMALPNACNGCGGRICLTRVLVDGKTWHRDCFVCQKCEKPLTGFIKENTHYYCVGCFEATFRPICLVSYFLPLPLINHFI